MFCPTDVMPSKKKVLLIVNCARDASYANRHVLREIYARQFDQIVFAISQSCLADRNFSNLVQTWDHRSLTNRCPCGDSTLADHATYFHSFHPRLADASDIASDFHYVVFTEDDCLVAPSIDSRTVIEMCDGQDAILPPISLCPRDDKGWIWTNHSAGYAAFDQVAAGLDSQRVIRNWERYSGLEFNAQNERLPMFKGFVDWMTLESGFLRALAGDLMLLKEVWHEAAIPTAVLHNTHRIGVSNGLALWGEQRMRTLDEMLAALRVHEFVHPVKPSRYLPEDLIRAYDAIRA